jgi:cytochrome P450
MQRMSDTEPCELMHLTGDQVARMGAERPLWRLRYPDGHIGWLALGHAACRQILGDARFSQQPIREPIDRGGFEEALAGPARAGDMLRNDPPQHTRLRRSQSRYFTVRRVDELREDVERIVAEHLDAMEAAGPPVDLVEMFALPIPSRALCRLLGVPETDRPQFEHPTEVIVAEDKTSPEDKRRAMGRFYDYIRGVIDQKRAQPTRDLLSELIESNELSDDELAGTAWFLFAAGHSTTANVITRSTLFLLSDRIRWDTVRADLSKIDRAVEELLRCAGGLHQVDREVPLNETFFLPRTATEDVEFDGTLIRAGESVTGYVIFPGGDPHKIGDLDRFDPFRDPTGHLAFSHGRHMCLGQHLARLELRVALGGLMERFPTLHLAEASQKARREAMHRLLVAW